MVGSAAFIFSYMWNKCLEHTYQCVGAKEGLGWGRLNSERSSETYQGKHDHPVVHEQVRHQPHLSESSKPIVEDVEAETSSHAKERDIRSNKTGKSVRALDVGSIRVQVVGSWSVVLVTQEVEPRKGIYLVIEWVLEMCLRTQHKDPNQCNWDPRWGWVGCIGR